MHIALIVVPNPSENAALRIDERIRSPAKSKPGFNSVAVR
jgi:hypothetical protein